jgi:hypothetical protein
MTITKSAYPIALLEDLKKEFPDLNIEELMAKADVRITAEELERAAATETPPAISPNGAEPMA